MVLLDANNKKPPRYTSGRFFVKILYMKFKIIWKRRYYKRGIRGNKLEYQKYKMQAQEIAYNRIIYFNSVYRFHVNKVTIKNQKTRWGSCSKKGNLNFNYKIALLPQYLSDYIIVHELCHLGQFNHSPAFWRLVAKTMPDYQKLKKLFKKIRL